MRQSGRFDLKSQLRIAVDRYVDERGAETHGYFGSNVVINNDILMVAPPGDPTRASNQRDAVLFSRNQHEHVGTDERNCIAGYATRQEGRIRAQRRA